MSTSQMAASHIATKTTITAVRITCPTCAPPVPVASGLRLLLRSGRSISLGDLGTAGTTGSLWIITQTASVKMLLPLAPYHWVLKMMWSAV